MRYALLLALLAGSALAGRRTQVAAQATEIEGLQAHATELLAASSTALL